MILYLQDANIVMGNFIRRHSKKGQKVMKMLKIITIFVLIIPTTVNAITLVTTTDPGFYNNSIGTLLNGTNGGESGPFPVSNDSNLNFPTAPDLSAASSVLGNWLTDPGNLNSNWSLFSPVPNSWAVGTEVAVIYEFNTGGATNVVASFGVDNGIFAWLDGDYLGGARRAGHPVPGEHVFNAGDLAPGTHYLQLLLEDHGSTNGYIVDITADTFLPPNPIPVPAAVWLFGTALLGLFGFGRRRKSI